MDGIQEKQKYEFVPNAKVHIGTRRGKILNCAICGKEFYRKPFQIKKMKLKPTCSYRCRGKFITMNAVQLGKNNPNWKGGKIQRSDGRVFIYAPNHPNANFNNTHILEYRLIATQKIGRPLYDNEIVHHLNGIVTDNRPENLEVMTSSDHAKIHCNHRNNITGRFE